jgi:hypothetical protein
MKRLARKYAGSEKAATHARINKWRNSQGLRRRSGVKSLTGSDSGVGVGAPAKVAEITLGFSPTSLREGTDPPSQGVVCLVWAGGDAFILQILLPHR